MFLAFVLAATFSLPPQKSDAHIGLTAIHLETGRTVSIRGGERFPMGSVYKVPIGIAVLKLVDAGKLTLEQKVTIEPKDFAGGWSPLRDEAKGKAVTRSVGELLELMVSISDNTASDALLKLIGGPKIATTNDVRVDRSEKEIHEDIEKHGADAYTRDVRDTTTPDAMAKLLVRLWRNELGLSKKSHALLVKHMTDSPTGKEKLRAAAPKGWEVAHKSGMMPRTSNDVGILTAPGGKQHIVIAVFATRATSDYAAIDADVAAAARAAIAELMQ